MRGIGGNKKIRLGVAALLALALVAVWAVAGRERTAIDEAPVEELLASAAAAPEVSTQQDIVPDDTAAEIEWDLRPAWNERVEFWVDFLTGRNRDKTRLWLERVGRYGPMIREALRERGMPEDLLYLAMIESGLSPRAYSRAHASGLWQFISETGRRYGLEVSGFVDERRDPVEATRAALDYLEDLYGQFGSWYLAAAAYNTGENRVERILRQRVGGARGDDALFWRIDQYLPRETRDYVPLMLAAGHIAKDPAKYGFEDLELQMPLRFDTVRVPGATSLRAVAKAAEVDYAEVKRLNPHLVRGTTPPDRHWAVRLPQGRRLVFASNFARMGREERTALIDHTVRRGETLSHIARRYGTTVRALQEANGWLNPRRIAVGQHLRVPAGRAYGDAEWRYYLVRRGDSLWAISRRYGVSVRQLQAWNDLGRRSRILPGQRLRIRS